MRQIMEDSNARPLTRDDLESIIDRLDLPDGGFPSDAIEEARKRSQEITPLLIRLIEDATDDCRRGHLDDCYGHFYGAFLLAEFRAVEAWPAIRAAISLPGQKPYELFGDAITEDFGCIIATLTGNGLEAIDDLVTDRSVDEYIRWAVCEVVLYRVRDGLLTKEDAIDWLAAHLEKAIDNKDELAEGLVVRLEDLAAERTLPLIEKAFAAGLIDDELYSLSDVREVITKGDEVFEETMARLHHADGLIDHLQGWTDHDSDWDVGVDGLPDEPFDSHGLFDALEDEYLPENDTTIRNDGVKIGRNDKCPCGSGKKYKKCCGRSSNLSM
jgi:hypothetical protein